MDTADLRFEGGKWMNGAPSRHTGGDLAEALGRITADDHDAGQHVTSFVEQVDRALNDLLDAPA